jgi:glycosyl transferase family WbsX
VPSAPPVIAFYLPQYYPIPENDAWYGAGFTEWRNVVQAQPLFPGHYQPHLPKDLGFYDLRVPEIRAAQARMAKTFGIDAFCYYHYWFEGQRPLRKVVDDVLNHGFPQMPFCLAWANENWSRHWDASANEVLLTQRYSAEDAEEHGLFLLNAMSHPLYLRVNGRPVLFIYRIQALPNPQQTLSRWREVWRAGGIADVEIVKFDTWRNFEDPRQYGADSAAQFPPHGIDEHVSRVYPAGVQEGNSVFDYEEVVRRQIAADAPAWRRHECVVPSFDNSPRRGDGGSFLLHGSTPELYGEWLEAIYRRAPEDGLVLINAWNEWAEGAHLEPDLRYGNAYLEATANAVGRDLPASQASGPTPLSNVAIAVGNRFEELYLDSIEAQTLLQRRLSRLEATFNRQVAEARKEAESEAEVLRTNAAALMRVNDNLRRQLDMLTGQQTDPHPAAGD